MKEKFWQTDYRNLTRRRIGWWHCNWRAVVVAAVLGAIALSVFGRSPLP